MHAQEVSSIIAGDLAQNPNFFNAHGVDVVACLVQPELVEFDDSFNDGKTISLWLVLKERPNEEDGYLVVYDEMREMFGLAIYGNDRPVFIGLYGSFTETLAGM